VLEFFVSIQRSQPGQEAAVDEAAYDPTIRGRLLDATSGAPVAGATCELWTEDFDEPGRLVESALSRADGSYELHPRSRDELKVRLRASGYRSMVVAGDDELELLYPDDEPLVVRVLDLDGQPIAGARVRSHQTCRHAPPAVEAVSGADGRAVLHGAPIFTSTDYEVRASGYGALVPVYFEDSGSEATVFLPRRAPVRLRLLEADGRPLAHRRFRQQGPGLTAFVTDADGGALLDSLFESREIGLEDVTKQLHMYGWPPLEGELVLTPDSEVGMQERELWPELHLVGAEPYASVHVQFGDDSVSHELDTRPARALDVRVRRVCPWSCSHRARRCVARGSNPGAAGESSTFRSPRSSSARVPSSASPSRSPSACAIPRAGPSPSRAASAGGPTRRRRQTRTRVRTAFPTACPAARATRSASRPRAPLPRAPRPCPRIDARARARDAAAPLNEAGGLWTLPGRDLPSRPMGIFKAYDIRGVVPGELDAALAKKIGNAFARLLKPGPWSSGQDMRVALARARGRVQPGHARRGANVIGLGLSETPMAYFAIGSHRLRRRAVRDRQPQSGPVQRHEAVREGASRSRRTPGIASSSAVPAGRTGAAAKPGKEERREATRRLRRLHVARFAQLGRECASRSTRPTAWRVTRCPACSSSCRSIRAHTLFMSPTGPSRTTRRTR
jgi:hypothetical protein